MTPSTAPLDVAAVRGDFPILERRVNDHPLVYLDSAATTSQKPRQVLEAMDGYYRRHNANVHRGVHTLAEATTCSRRPAASWRASSAPPSGPRCSPRTSARPSTWSPTPGGCATSARRRDPGHRDGHLNLVPWQLVASMTGARVRAIPVTGDYQLDLEALDGLLGRRTRMVAVSAMSNVLGTVNPVAEIAEQAHAAGALVLADAAQAVPHAGVRLDTLGVDFLGFTGRKALGPMGVGVLAAREELLEGMEPFLGGRDDPRRPTSAGPPGTTSTWRFEAGTPAMAEAVGLGAAVDYLQALGMDRVRAHEVDVTGYALKRLGGLDLGWSSTAVRGRAPRRHGLVHPRRHPPRRRPGARRRRDRRAGRPPLRQPLLRRLGVQATTGPRSTCTRPPRRSTRWSPASRRSAGSPPGAGTPRWASTASTRSSSYYKAPAPGATRDAESRCTTTTRSAGTS